MVQYLREKSSLLPIAQFDKEMLTYMKMESTLLRSHPFFCLCRPLAQPSERSHFADFTLFPRQFGNADVLTPAGSHPARESGFGGKQSPQFLRSCLADGGFESIDPFCLSSLHGSSSGGSGIGHIFRGFSLAETGTPTDTFNPANPGLSQN
jgi:hypothetical protein